MYRSCIHIIRHTLSVRPPPLGNVFVRLSETLCCCAHNSSFKFCKKNRSKCALVITKKIGTLQKLPTDLDLLHNLPHRFLHICDSFSMYKMRCENRMAKLWIYKNIMKLLFLRVIWSILKWFLNISMLIAVKNSPHFLIF